MTFDTVLTITLTVIITFVSGLFLALLLQFMKDRKTKNQLENHLKKACKHFLEQYQYYESNRGERLIITRFPQIEQIIYSGQLHFFDTKIQDSMSHILMSQKTIDDMVTISLEQLYLSDTPTASKRFFTSYTEIRKKTKSYVEELLGLLE